MRCREVGGKNIKVRCDESVVRLGEFAGTSLSWFSNLLRRWITSLQQRYAVGVKQSAWSSVPNPCAKKVNRGSSLGA